MTNWTAIAVIIFGYAAGAWFQARYIDAKLQGLDAKLDAKLEGLKLYIDARFETVNLRLNRIEARLDKLEERLGVSK